MRPVRYLIIMAAIMFATAASAAYTTPGFGVDWTMDDLVAASGGVVTGGGGSYQFHDSVVIAVGDRLTVAAGSTLLFFGGVAWGSRSTAR